jgi:virulence factor
MARTTPSRTARPGRSRRQVRVAIVGAGGRAVSTHYPALRELPDADLVAVAELDDNRLHAAANQFGIKGRYTNYVEMIEREKPDAVYAIMSPHQLYDVAATIIDMGCHLFIEKPPAVNAEQVRQLELLARRKKVLTGVTFQRRFSPLIRQGRERCAQRGPIHTAHASFYKNWVGASPYYRGAMDMLTCDGIHAVDTLRFLCGGEVESVASDNRRLDAGHWNIHLAVVRFSSGATGVLLVNFMSGRRQFTVEVHGPGICFFGDPEVGGQVYADNKPEPVAVLDPFELSDSREPYRAFGGYDVNRHFIECVQQNRQPETHFADALKTMELVEAVYRSQI